MLTKVERNGLIGAPRYCQILVTPYQPMNERVQIVLASNLDGNHSAAR
jgi:hypothetical protein